MKNTDYENIVRHNLLTGETIVIPIFQYKRNDIPIKVPSRRPRKSLYHAQRNDPCPCGSGKKFKKCCIDKTLN